MLAHTHFRSCLRARLLFFFNGTATSEIYTLSLHDALPISDLLDRLLHGPADFRGFAAPEESLHVLHGFRRRELLRSEEHTSELQSQFHLVCRLLLEKKNPHIALERPGHSLAVRPYPHVIAS